MYAFGFFLFTGIYKCIKQTLLTGIFPAHVFRVPLDTQAERMIGMYDCFHETVLTDGTDGQILSQRIHSLVVETVDGELLCF